MTGTNLYWIEGPGPGRLALAARPRGGEWLGDEMKSWQRSGVNLVLSLLTKEEEADLDLGQENNDATEHGMRFLSFPILDREVPDSESKLAEVLHKLTAELDSGKNAVVHCRQGIGRTGLVAACLLVSNGIDPATAVQRLSAARGLPVPETPEQRRWIDHHAPTFGKTR